MSRAGVLAAVILILAPDDVAGQLVMPVDDTARRGMAIGSFEAVGTTLAPCLSGRREAFVRRIKLRDGIWAARFSATQLGTGAWTLHVEAADGSQRQSAPVTAAATGAFEWVTAPVYGTAIRVILEGPADAAAACPAVVLHEELTIHHKSVKRGLVGSDDRWTEDSPELKAAADGALITTWGQGIAHVEVLTASGGVIPCTGFFVSAHVMVTAAHCIASHEEARATRLFVSGQEIRGHTLRLLMAQDIDFSLVWVDAPQPAFLSVSETPSGASLLWQRPSLAEKKVSAVGCVTKANSGLNVEHQCDSMPGASGAPLQDRASGAVIGVHVVGCLSEYGKPSCVNGALRMTEVRARIRALLPELQALDPVAAAEVIAAFGIS